jgi:hypothetical protein
MKIFTLDFSKIRDNSISQQFSNFCVNSNIYCNESDEPYFKLREIESIHIKRTSKIRRIRRALRRHGIELQVRNYGYGMKKNGKS